MQQYIAWYTDTYRCIQLCGKEGKRHAVRHVKTEHGKTHGSVGYVILYKVNGHTPRHLDGSVLLYKNYPAAPSHTASSASATPTAKEYVVYRVNLKVSHVR